MKKTILTGITLFWLCILFAQEDSSLVSKDKISSRIKVAYNGAVVYPGIRIGLAVPVAMKQLDKTKRSGKQKTILKDRFLTANIGWYHHQSFHDNIYFTAGYTQRRTNKSGVFTEWSPEIGYSRTFLGGTTYTVSDKGQVAVKKLAGYHHAIISVGGGVGYDFSVSTTKPLAIYSKLNIISMFPYNSTFYIRPVMEIGVIYQPKNFLKVNTTVRKVTRNKANK